jgi:uncharacterized protein (TIGR02996 family)
MTDDEAFVRRIVDSPGDDAPRLVYADWLDDRGDPRGAYLRAEAAHPGDVGRLDPLAAGLDAVWVARVSRPPVGVCIDAVEMMDTGPRLNPGDIRAAESRLGVEIPADYEGFLLNHNGGCIRLGGWNTPNGVFGEVVHTFHPIEQISRCRRLADADAGELDRQAMQWFSQYITVGLNPDEIYGVMLGVVGSVRGTVILHDFSSAWTPAYTRPNSMAARSFAEYLPIIDRA